MKKRILVPLDGSALSDRIVRHVRRLLVRNDFEIVLLGVVDPKGGAMAEQRARDHLEAVRDELVADGALASVEVAQGEPAQAIVDCAARKEASLVAMATHGRTGIARWLQGSVAEAVVRACPTPVFVSNPMALDDDAAELDFERILVPLDGTEGSLGILPTVEAMARAYGSEVLLLRVEWTVPMATYPAELATLRAPAEVAQLLEPTRKRLEDAGVRARTLVAYGPEATEILDAADREGVDLVAMSTHGRQGVSRWLFGSIAEQVIRYCKHPLLVNRVAAAQAVVSLETPFTDALAQPVEPETQKEIEEKAVPPLHTVPTPKAAVSDSGYHDIGGEGGA